ncbi:MAG: VOC family protein [Ideonella sp.]|nr:VOC family protein [Ideonella sp.]MBL0150621.1 VOC family protein [Ideonella sp.]
MPAITLEHANITVTDPDRALRFFTTALPGWRVRGGGEMDWYGKPIRWTHVGTDDVYIALQSGGEGPGPDWQGHATGVKHLGLVVDDIDAAVARLQRDGFAVDHWGGQTAHRRSVYLMVGADFQVELVQYLSRDAALRNAYAA